MIELVRKTHLAHPPSRPSTWQGYAKVGVWHVVRYETRSRVWEAYCGRNGDDSSHEHCALFLFVTQIEGDQLAAQHRRVCHRCVRTWLVEIERFAWALAEGLDELGQKAALTEKEFVAASA